MKKVKDILSKTKTFTRDDFTKILRTCHNIIRNNDKLSPEAAFDEISKILFMKIKYEREQRGAKVFTKNEFVEKEILQAEEVTLDTAMSRYGASSYTGRTEPTSFLS